VLILLVLPRYCYWFLLVIVFPIVPYMEQYTIAIALDFSCQCCCQVVALVPALVRLLLLWLFCFSAADVLLLLLVGLMLLP